MMSWAWLGLFLSLNQTAQVHTPLKSAVAVEATAVAAVGKLTLTGIFIQPVQGDKKPVYSVGLGVRVF